MNIKWTESTAHTFYTAHYNELFIGEVIARTDTTLKTLFEAFVSTAPMRNKPIGLCETLEIAKARVEEWAREQINEPVEFTATLHSSASDNFWDRYLFAREA